MPLYSSYTLMVRLMIQYVVGQGSGVMSEVLSDRTKHHKPAWRISSRRSIETSGSEQRSFSLRHTLRQSIHPPRVFMWQVSVWCDAITNTCACTNMADPLVFPPTVPISVLITALPLTGARIYSRGAILSLELLSRERREEAEFESIQIMEHFQVPRVRKILYVRFRKRRRANCLAQYLLTSNQSSREIQGNQLPYLHLTSPSFRFCSLVLLLLLWSRWSVNTVHCHIGKAGKCCLAIRDECDISHFVKDKKHNYYRLIQNYKFMSFARQFPQWVNLFI